MKKIKSQLFAVLTSILLGTGLVHAQDSANSSGGDATGSGGSASYSVGQVVYTTQAGTNGSAAQGVQQPYEISIPLGVQDATLHLGLTTYPNPTTNSLTLSVSKTDFSGLSFALYDQNGKQIESRKMQSSTETIDMSTLPVAVYFIKVADNNQEVQTFKVVKN